MISSCILRTGLLICAKQKGLLFLLALLILFPVTKGIAQNITTNAYSTAALIVSSYRGLTSFQNTNVQFDLNSNNLNVQNWSLLVRSNGPIKNSRGITIDPSKLSIRINEIKGNGPTIQQIGASVVPIPLSLVNVPVFQNAKAPLYTGPYEYYKQFIISFDVILAGGEYLTALKSYETFYINLSFSLVDANKKVISTSNMGIPTQIYPLDSPPVEAVYGIAVNSNASVGVLEFKSISDYVNGVSQTYVDGLSVISSTPYEVQVRTLSSNFESGTNRLPVSTVKLQISDRNNASTGGTVTLSESQQTIFNATNSGTQPRLFNLRYYTTPNDQRLIQSKSSDYRAIVTYTLIPR
jgi:hypothetical protein